jgi:hypothetical protein
MNFKSLTTALNFRERIRRIALQTFGGKRNVNKTLGYKERPGRQPTTGRACAQRGREPRGQGSAEGHLEGRSGRHRRRGSDYRDAVRSCLGRPGRASQDLVEVPAGRHPRWHRPLRDPPDWRSGQPGLATGEREGRGHRLPAGVLRRRRAVSEYEIDITSPRFGHAEVLHGQPHEHVEPDVDQLRRRRPPGALDAVLHIADGLLDDNVFGEPRLQCIWNRLDDLEKVAGGGAEAFWRRADAGIQFDLDPTLELDEPAKESMKKQIEAYEHEMKRMLTTRGVKINQLGSDVADFSNSVNSIISLISAGTGIPQRVLMGSEQAKLASKMDRSNWDERVEDRRKDYAAPHVVRPFIDRMINSACCRRRS